MNTLIKSAKASRLVFALAALIALSAGIAPSRNTATAQGTGGTFTTIDFPGASVTFASRNNSSGDIVGRYISAGVTHGFLLSWGELTSIDFPGASFTTANGINPSGDIVGRYISAGVQHGFLLSGGEFTSFD
ncbi:hypothetical protein L0222_24795, partial [bacterium]|nr:hypothetical protein [bacterium]